MKVKKRGLDDGEPWGTPKNIKTFVTRNHQVLSLLLAIRRLACRWGRSRAPKFKDWLKDLTHCLD